ncbi:ferredoxin-type protein NapF [Polycladidibacter stylochi]|uniref:ferredoxin-type protein NapF n=1 Tax=Polycladidibacter stylochi TaxID=1807766 RepID=UPI00082DB3C0|nr:ferredoxin-type protein NapF [Pseudovibrio stylochi]
MRHLFKRNNENKAEILPPYTKTAEDYAEKCVSCGDCIQACPENVLVKSPTNQRPHLDFTQGSCSYCTQCAVACEAGALTIENAKPLPVKAQITPSCLSYQGITCRSCAEYCEQSAIRFHLATQGKQIPQLDTQACNGCGACFYICPNNSIEMIRQPTAT